MTAPTDGLWHPSESLTDYAERQAKRAAKAEADLAAARAEIAESMTRAEVEALMASKLPCGHPEACAYHKNEAGTQIGCGWCDGIQAQKAIADMACEHAGEAEAREYKTWQPLKDMIEELEKQLAAAQATIAGQAPIPMVIVCPCCRLQHIDEPEPERGWTNPPHKSHLCHGCGAIWRVASVPTNGVAFISPFGANDTWRPAPPAKETK